jgi:hypothetical protein
MGITDELLRLKTLRDSGALTEPEFERAKTLALKETQSQTQDLRLTVIECENKLAQIDKDWSIERGKYQIKTRHGKEDPTHGGSLGGCVVIGLVGAVTMGMGLMAMNSPRSGAGKPGAAAMPGLWYFIGFIGFCLILAGIAESLRQSHNVDKLEQARKAYQSNRARAVSKLEEAQRQLRMASR